MDLKGNVFARELHWSQLSKLILLLPATENHGDSVTGMKLPFIN